MFQTISMSCRAAWKTLITLLVRHQVEQRGEIDAGGERVDDDGFVGRGHLRHAEQRVIGGFAQEFGVDRDERMLRHARANLGRVPRSW